MTQGTRLWIFQLRDKWSEVKVPDREQRGWIWTGQIAQLVPTESQRARLKVGYDQFNAYQRLRKAGRGAEGINGIRECLAVEREIWGDDHIDVASTWGFLADELRQAGKFAEAAEAYRLVVDIRRRLLGRRDENTLNASHALATLLNDLGESQRARATHRETLEIRTEDLGPKHTRTLGSMNNLANALESAGDFRGAEELHRQTLDLKREQLGDKHPQTLASMNNLATILRALGSYTAARTMLEETLTLKRDTFGQAHPLTIGFLSNLSVMQAGAGDTNDALSSFDKIRRATRKYAATLLPELSEAEQLQFPRVLATSRLANSLTFVLLRWGSPHARVRFADYDHVASLFPRRVTSRSHLVGMSDLARKLSLPGVECGFGKDVDSLQRG